MHPTDQFEAFEALIDSAHGIEDVAVRFGVTLTVARRRLKQRPRDPTAAHGGAERCSRCWVQSGERRRDGESQMKG